ncbi:MAG: caspase family protein [Fimbriimonadaceae bacterium]|nr:caspase family protein [Fimbriimonadaceae bacterium]
MRGVKVGLSLASLWVLTVLPANAWAEKYALLVGVNRYKSADIRPLRFSGNDVNALSDVLITRGGFRREHVVPLTGDQGNTAPTAENIFNELERIRQRAKPGDTVLFYFTGHGSEVDGQTYLLPYEVDPRPGRFTKTAYAAREITAELSRISGASLIVIYDMCRNDPFGSKALSQDPLSQRQVKELIITSNDSDRVNDGPKCSTTIFSCKPNQKSYEWDTHKRSYFSYFFEEALRGPGAGSDHLITVDEAVTYAAARVPVAVKKDGVGPQDPEPHFSGVGAATTVLAESRRNPIETVDEEVDPFAYVSLVVVNHLGTPVTGYTALMDGNAFPLGGKIPVVTGPTRVVEIAVQLDKYNPRIRRVTVQRGQRLELKLELSPIDGVNNDYVTLRKKADSLQASATHVDSSKAFVEAAKISPCPVNEWTQAVYNDLVYTSIDWGQMPTYADQWRKALQVANSQNPDQIHKGTRFHFVYAWIQRASGESSLAEALAAQKSDPTWEFAEALVALSYQDQRQYSEANRVWQTLLSKPGTSTWTLRKIGIYYTDIQPNYVEAERAFRASNTKTPKSAFTLGRLANALHEQGKYADAIKFGMEALAVDPRDGYAANTVGRAHFSTSQYEKAAEYFRTAKSTDLKEVAYPANLGLALSRLKRYSEAKVELEAAIAIRPRHVSSRSELSMIMYNEQKYGDALRHIEEALLGDPKYGYALEMKAGILVQLNRKDEAKAFAERALQNGRKRTDWPWLYDQLLAP